MLTLILIATLAAPPAPSTQAKVNLLLSATHGPGPEFSKEIGEICADPNGVGLLSAKLAPAAVEQHPDALARQAALNAVTVLISGCGAAGLEAAALKLEEIRLARDLTWTKLQSTAGLAINDKDLRPEAARLRMLLSSQVSIERAGLRALSAAKSTRLVGSSLGRLPTEGLLQLELVSYLATVTQQDSAVTATFQALTPTVTWRPVVQRIDAYLKGKP